MGALALAMAAAAVVGCKKEKETETSQKELESQENSFVDLNGIHVKVHRDTLHNSKGGGSEWLYFESKTDYELAITTYRNATDSVMSAFEEALAYSSMRSSLTREQREELEIEDDLLAMMLSPTGVIQIGDYKFLIEVCNDKVLVYDQTLPNPTPLSYSVDDEIFNLLEGNKDSGEKGCSAKNKENGIVFANTKIDCKVVYQRAGIYFSLQSKIKKRVWGGDVELHLTCESGTSTYKRNRDESIYQIAGTTLYGLNHSYNYRPYSGSRKLVNFHFSVHFNAYNLANNTNMGWRHMQINCGD